MTDDAGDEIEQEFIQQRFLDLLYADKLQEAFAIYDSVDEVTRTRIFHFVCGAAAASWKVAGQLIDTIKKLTKDE